MYTFEHILKAGSKVILNGPIKIHAQFINKFDTINVRDFIRDAQGDLRDVFILSSRVFCMYLRDHPEIYEKCYLPHKNDMTVPERRDALTKIGNIKLMYDNQSFRAEIQDLLNNYSSVYSMDSLIIYQKVSSGTAVRMTVQNDYTALLAALAEFYRSYEMNNPKKITGLVLQEYYESTIADYLAKINEHKNSGNDNKSNNKNN